MESPIEVVRRFCAAWSEDIGAEELAAFFTDDAVYHNIPLAPVSGREAIANTIASFIRPGPPGIEGIGRDGRTTRDGRASMPDDRSGLRFFWSPHPLTPPATWLKRVPSGVEVP
jgi:hypothetical protein